MSMTLVKSEGLATLHRKEGFGGRCTARVEWVVSYNGRIFATYNTKREALAMFAAYA
jgi:hypothetical protein